MWKCVFSVKQSQDDSIIFAGKHEISISHFKLILKTISGVSKPALAAIWPNNIKMNIVLDLGANIECMKIICENSQNLLYSFINLFLMVVKPNSKVY